MTALPLRVVTDPATEHARLLRIEAAARNLVDSVDIRRRAGWLKAPFNDVELLRKALDGDL